ncbi:hypothetical protein BDQ12DRAFT_686775 [Crucibulum laeve]|uniref:Helicase C-terminal domain-containing protein n=1 Tax=Crucibulum laeve TaxID=68775 RepID=A0A5C3M5G2_9AGAR|nr:hypothetical protein BDQ12DRAFT_686775 [Crucibulum laeve]
MTISMFQHCSSCCAACNALESRPNSSSSKQSPFALANLLPVGTVSLKLLPDSQQALCDHEHAEDGWHSFRGTALLGHLSTVEDIGFCRDLEFLLKHQFISATYLITSHAELLLRIYFIPYDLANVQGKLRTRKDSVVAPAKRYMRRLLPQVVKDVEGWEGSWCGKGTPLVQDTKDGRTLAEIYGDLASPNPAATPGWEQISGRLLNFEDDLKGFGMRSTLYKYQRRSVAAMMQQELDSRDVPDPLFIPLTAMNGKKFYLQPGTMEVLQEKPMVAPCRGEILCEELGTGKTVMILSLVLTTLNQLPLPEESIIDDRPVMTPLAFRHFPSSEFNTARQCFLRGKEVAPGADESRVPSLVELLVHRARTTPVTSLPDLTTAHGQYLYEKRQSIEDTIELVPAGALLRANVPFYHHYPGEPSNHERVQRMQTRMGPKVMYLSSATIVVVPANLLSQWDREITKHCEVPLRVLILRARTPMPSVKDLAGNYDVILLTYTRFTAEANASSLTKLYTWKHCTCPSIPGSRVPDCICPSAEVSPFLQIRWKRLVIDEGHVSASLSTILIPFTKRLSVERRWIVTGTPTTNLLGLSLGKKTSEEAASQMEDQDKSMEDLFGNEIPVLMDVGDSPPSPSSSAGSSTTSSRRGSVSLPLESLSARVWNKYDREDLNKLGNMITHFIAVPQFTADSKLVQTHVTEPLLDAGGPRPGSIQVLNQVMEMIMIRHRIEDVEEDVVLPPVMQESVMLDLDPFVVKSYNALQATIAINAIDSQRTDQDYMFHPSNADALRLTVKNMSQIMFWSVDDGLYQTDQLLRDAEIHIKRAIERGTPPEDMKLLYDAFKHIRLAADDRLWRAIQTHEDVPYRVYNMNEQVYNAWTRMPPGSEPSSDKLLHADRLQKIHDVVIGRPLVSEDRMADWGTLVNARDRDIRRLYEESQKRKNSRSKGKGAKNQEEHTSSLMVDSAARKATSPETLKEMRRELDVSMARLESLGTEDEPSTPMPSNTSHVEQPSKLVAASFLANVRIGSSASNKLNYIINEVLKYSPAEKFLIFSDSELTLAHVAEALALVKVKFLRFTTQIQPQVREQLVLTFETSQTYRVFLMELKHGARGLNLISASRVIFCEPVWQADVESQAIKRAHRIGQTRPITVKTLAIRGTAEETMVKRRNILKSSQDKVPKLLEEAGMRHYIANPTFIESQPTVMPLVDFPLFNLPPSQPQQPLMLRIPARSTSASPNKRVRVEDLNYDVETVQMAETSEPRPKKRKTVRFG